MYPKQLLSEEFTKDLSIEIIEKDLEIYKILEQFNGFVLRMDSHIFCFF